MRVFALVILYIFSLLAWAKPSCEADLINISKNARHDQRAYGLQEELMDAIINDSIDAWNQHYNCHEGEVLVFRERWPYRSKEDQGFRVSLSQDRRGRLWLERVKPSDPDEEREYFQRLADCNDVNWMGFDSTYPLQQSRRVEIPPRVQMKLLEKHRFYFQDVQEAFANRKSEPVPTRKHNVLEFISETNAGTRVLVWTKYDRSQGAWVLVSMFHPDR